MGLSVSQVLYIIVTSILTLVVGITSTLANLSSHESDTSTDRMEGKLGSQIKVTPVPVAVLIIGLVIGASLGVYARTNEWFGPNVQSFVRKWKATGLTEAEITQRLFNNLYAFPAIASSEANGSNILLKSGNVSDSLDDTRTEKRPLDTGKPIQKSSKGIEANVQQGPFNSHSGLLFSTTLEECQRLYSSSPDELRQEMASSGDPRISRLAKRCENTACLKALIEEIICPRK
ncbi:MAG: hypothetical protein DMF61_17920 [Blastocatellia bacterium AA13]|nr:MAG: hypothetical protein DMF61_17920 [Blastocatellia bacterium AA13]